MKGELGENSHIKRLIIVAAIRNGFVKLSRVLFISEDFWVTSTNSDQLPCPEFQWWRQLKTEIDSRRNADFLQSAALDKIQLYIFSQSPVFTRTYKSHSANKNPVASASLKLSQISMMQIFPIRKFKQTSQESRTVLENYSLFIYKKKTSLSARCSKLYKMTTLAVKYQ